MNRRSSPQLAALLIFLAACGGDRPPTSPGVPTAPSLQLSDGRSGGNKDFFFLPPLAANPSGHPNFSAGQFNATLKPTVEICPLSVNKKGVLQQVPLPDQHCASPTRVFSKAEVALVASDELYQANWKVSESVIDVSRIYRIRVFVESRELGFVDVDPVTKTEYRRYPTGENVPLSSSRSLPIKFRIENGALVVPGTTDYVETNVPQTGGTNTAVVIKNGVPTPLVGTLVTTNAGTAAAFFPNGWLPGGYPNGVLVKIVRVPVGPDNNCHGTAGIGLLQYEGCYEYTTDPVIPLVAAPEGSTPAQTSFAKAVYVAQCAEFRNAAEARVQGGVLFKSSAREPLTPLPPVVPSFLPACGEYSGTPSQPVASTNGSATSRGASGFAAATWKAVTSRVVDFLTPRSAIAFDLGVGGEAFSFSHIGYGVRTAVAVAGGDAQTNGIAGQALPTPVSVRVVAQHEHPDGDIDLEPLPGVAVTFAPQDGGSAVPITATTGADGIASATWTLGTATTHTLIASIPSPSTRPYGGASQVTFTATTGGTTDPGPAVAISGLVSDTRPNQAAVPQSADVVLLATDGSGASRTLAYSGQTGAYNDALRADVPTDAAFFGKAALLQVTVLGITGAPETRTALVSIPQAPGTVTQAFSIAPRVATITGTVRGVNPTTGGLGTAVAGALVRLGPFTTGGVTTGMSVLTNDAGAYTFQLQGDDPVVAPNAPASFYSVSASGHVTLPFLFANLLPARNLNADIALLPNGAQGILTQALAVDQADQARPGLAVRVANESYTEGGPSPTEFLTQFDTVTDADGRFRFYVPLSTVLPADGNGVQNFWYGVVGPSGGFFGAILKPAPTSPTYVTTGFKF